jgi:glycosyltransferase involved in cell wall biosynthesis
VVLPCLDEEDNIGRAIREAFVAARRVAARCEIIVVDDGSQDATAVIAAAVPGVRVIRHPVNRGYGAAVRSGLRAAQMPYVVITDADLQFDLGALDEFAAGVGDADVLVGRRRSSRDPWRRRVARYAWNWLARRMLPLPIHDPDCALKLLRREVLNGIELTSDGPAISAELLTRCLQSGARLAELDVDARARRAGGRPRGHLPRFPAALRELTALRQTLAPVAQRP